MTPAIQRTLATALRHWYGDAQGQHAHTFRGVSLETLRTVRQHPAVREAVASVETVVCTGDVAATRAMCQGLTRIYEAALTGQAQKTVAACRTLALVYKRVLRERREEVAA